MLINSVCASSQEIVISIPVSIFQDKILSRYSQKVVLLKKVFGNFSITKDQAFWQIISGNWERKNYTKSTFLVIPYQGGY